MASEVSICSTALMLIGDDSISSLNESNDRARVCNQMYADTRDEVLTEHPWNFATVRSNTLALLAVAPTFEYDYAHQIPTDPKCLRVLSVGELSDNIEWRREGDTILSNESSIYIRYIKQMTDPQVFSPLFRECLEYKLAAKIAYPLSNNTALSDRIMAMYETRLRSAKSANGQESSIKEIYAEDFITVR